MSRCGRAVALRVRAHHECGVAANGFVGDEGLVLARVGGDLDVDRHRHAAADEAEAVGGARRRAQHVDGCWRGRGHGGRQHQAVRANGVRPHAELGLLVAVRRKAG